MVDGNAVVVADCCVSIMAVHGLLFLSGLLVCFVNILFYSTESATTGSFVDFSNKEEVAEVPSYQPQQGQVQPRSATQSGKTAALLDPA